MTEQQFLALCASAAQHFDGSQQTMLAHHGEIEVDGVAMGLFFDEQDAPDLLSCYVDLGPVPRKERAEILEHLLTLNLLSGSKTTGVYAIDPASGNAIFIIHLYEPELLEGQVLAQALRTYAVQANTLRAGLLKHADASSPAPAPAGPNLVDLA